MTKKKDEFPTLKNGELEQVIRGLTAIGDLQLEDWELTYNITRNTSALESALNARQKVLHSHQKTHCMLEGGEPVMIEIDKGIHDPQFKSDKDRTAYTAKLEKMNEKEVGDVKLFWLSLATMRTEKERLDGVKDAKSITANMLFLVEKITNQDLD